ncbi:N-acetyltransferase GCN5 [Knoellia subterranea KCTC 19937]|uniref:N-acetyltransferase GCN5 n=2 Tax=Knoellia TaxID=136099 RepID=A0A0A0JMY5_9MICO|nr:N-acetyltransferase GCN5 [Knoellia subterranea KCTC 19937]
MVEVSAVPKEDLGDLVGLWVAAKVDAGVPLEVATRFANDGRFESAIQRADVNAHLARIDGRPVGYVLTSENPFGLNPEPEVAVEQLYVDPTARRHGVARSLLCAVVGHAERSGSDVIVSNVPTQSREAHRFFARLGFSSVVVRRVVSTTQLRRRLAPQGSAINTAVDQLIRRRRSLRSIGTRAS